MCAVCLLGGMAAHEAFPQDKPVMSDELFKNVQVLKGIPVDEFLRHDGNVFCSDGTQLYRLPYPRKRWQLGAYADDNQLKRTTRGMVAMVNSINKSYFGGRHGITCY